MNYQLYQSIHNLSGHSTILDDLMIFFTNYALVIYALCLLGIWFLGGNKSKRMGLYALGTGIIALAMNFVISKIYYEDRPFVTHHVHILIEHAPDASFPSDHATGAFAIAFALWARNRKIGVPMIILAIITGFSRVWVGVHYPFDVVGSIVVAAIVAFIICKLERFLNPIPDAIIKFYNSIFGRKSKNNYKKSL
ncbi:undecaprenyl-diphosphatase [Bacillus sp. FJAT-49736]|uniref:undecaprenyl-diphosphatase n=1 Tax=Bacillus sp. FJAT-49736 TaxID=2833582 RepID=UPI001BC96FC3|nr:undecaprenyl-diphosphatase [Bacillus sp. FJAT-49736]MBS4174075.1 undecaprenyl-diphosphatase [Bacillus sp. FJAT-49736]